MYSSGVREYRKPLASWSSIDGCEQSCGARSIMIVDQLYEEFEDWLRRFDMGPTRDGDRADDLVQDTMIRALAG